MSTVMFGTETAKHMKEELIRKTQKQKEKGIVPCLAIIRVGERPDDMSYEKGAKKRMELIGAETRSVVLPEDISQEELEREFRKQNKDENVHGILLLRPLPAGLEEEPLRNMIDPRKDLDCMSPVNMAKVFTGDESGYAPCTPEAVIKLLEYYEIPLQGKKVTVVGRSMVAGKPLAMLLLKKDATVTICHTKTVDLAKECQEADVLIAAAGKARMITADMVREGAVVVDVGINIDTEGNLCGDVDYDEVKKKVASISPVPRGVGSVTTSVLASHLLRSAEQ